jgi:hypothetical protein
MIDAGVSMMILVGGAALIVVGVLVLWRQTRAASCSRHRRWAGGMAIILACACLLAGIGLCGLAVSQSQDMSRLLSRVVAGLKHWVGIKEPPPYKPPALPQADAERVVDRLIGMGFLKFAPETKRADVRRQLIEAATKRYLDSDWNDDSVPADLRSYPADSEDLAEGQVGATILLMRPVLEREGVNAPVPQQPAADGRARPADAAPAVDGDGSPAYAKTQPASEVRARRPSCQLGTPIARKGRQRVQSPKCPKEPTATPMANSLEIRRTARRNGFATLEVARGPLSCSNASSRMVTIDWG